MLTVVKAFVSGLFSGMAQDQARRGDFPGTLKRAQAALSVADQPVTRFAAHAQMAKAYLLGHELEQMQAHKARALMILSHNPAIGSTEEAMRLKAELDLLP